jgi:hypothetical protein
VIGYYVHHRGRGHLQRARAITAQLDEDHTVLSSLRRPEGWEGLWIELDSDQADRKEPCEQTARGAFHWAPLQHPGMRARMAQIADWIGTAQPAAVVCDVSVEVACFARLMGVPVITIALPGVRADAPHLLGYGLSEAIIAPWPGGLGSTKWPTDWCEKIHAVGAFSRFDQRTRATQARQSSVRTVAVLMGAGGSEVSHRDLADAAAATPSWSWRAYGPGHWIEDPWPALCDATVIVTHAGQNAISEVAAARRPAVVIPQSRPFEEQLSTARILRRERLAVVPERWPEPRAWPALLEQALSLGGERWTVWNDGQGVRRAAQVIEGVVKRGTSQAA